MPGAIGDMHFAVAAYTGADIVLYVLPRAARLWLIARKIRQNLEARGFDVTRLNCSAVADSDGKVILEAGKVVTFALIDGSIYRVTADGFEPFHPSHAS